jgi:hypothetical protein
VISIEAVAASPVEAARDRQMPNQPKATILEKRMMVSAGEIPDTTHSVQNRRKGFMGVKRRRNKRAGDQ